MAGSADNAQYQSVGDQVAPAQGAKEPEKSTLNGVFACFCQNFPRLSYVTLLCFLTSAVTWLLLSVSSPILFYPFYKGWMPFEAMAPMYIALALVVVSVAACLTWPFATALTLQVISKEPRAWSSVCEHTQALLRCGALFLLKISPIIIWTAGFFAAFIFFFTNTDVEKKKGSIKDKDIPWPVIAGLIVTPLLCWVWVTYVWVHACLAPCLVMDKLCNASNAMSASKTLVKGYRARIILVHIGLSVLTSLLLSILVLPIVGAIVGAFVGDGPDRSQKIAGYVNFISALINLALSPLYFLVPPHMYLYVRAKDGRAAEVSGLRQSLINGSPV